MYKSQEYTGEIVEAVKEKMGSLFLELDKIYPTFILSKSLFNVKVILISEEYAKSGVAFFPFQEFLSSSLPALLAKVATHLNTFRAECPCCSECPKCTCQRCDHFFSRSHFNSFVDRDLKRVILGEESNVNKAW